MRIVIAGGHGQIAMRLEKLLAERGDSPVGIIRDPEQAEDLRAAGADPVVCDLESAAVDEVARYLNGADARWCSRPAPGQAVGQHVRRRWTAAPLSYLPTLLTGREYAGT